MSKRTIEKIIQREETKRIIELAEEALGGAQEARKRIRLSTEAAIKCGHLLNAEKRFVTKEMGRGYWLSYFEINFAKVLPIRTATHWMKLESAIADSPKAELTDTSEIENSGFSTESNVMRLGMLALDLFPKKIPLAIEGNAPAPKLNASYLAHVAWLEDWFAALGKECLETPMDPARRRQLQGDFRKVDRFCRELFAS